MALDCGDVAPTKWFLFQRRRRLVAILILYPKLTEKEGKWVKVNS
jgi:hypothetical protein